MVAGARNQLQRTILLPCQGSGTPWHQGLLEEGEGSLPHDPEDKRLRFHGLREAVNGNSPNPFLSGTILRPRGREVVQVRVDSDSGTASGKHTPTWLPPPIMPLRRASIARPYPIDFANERRR